MTYATQKKAISCCWVALVLCSMTALGGPPITWVEDSFEDFADGQLDAAGQNLYINRGGDVRIIHRFDLNQDGNLDLIFNSTHDTFTYIPATLGSVKSSRHIQRSDLAVEGSLQVSLEDLNRDGHLDAIFCPNQSGLQNLRRLITIVWGDKEGWSNQRSNGQLPVYGASAVATADLNLDQWPDIVTLNKQAWLPDQPEGNILRVFWGSKAGFLLNEKIEIGIPQALDLAAADFDGDGHKDVAVLTGRGMVDVIRGQAASEAPNKLSIQSVALPDNGGLCLSASDADNDGQNDLLIGTNHGKVYMVQGQSGSDWGETKTWLASNASHITVGDLNSDQYPDLVLTDFALAHAKGGEAAGADKNPEQLVRIFWGTPKGFDRSSLTNLTVPYAKATAIGDLDGDGLQDLAVAVHQNSHQFETNSLLFFGTGTKTLEKKPLGIRTIGASDAAIVPPTNLLPGRVVFCNSLGGTVAERVPLYVYWGSSTGFSQTNRWEIPFQSGYEASAADLNVDGYVDLIVLNSQHAGEAAAGDPTAGANILWGSSNGFDLDKQRTVLKERNLGSSNVADLNRDGYLDLVLGAFETQGEKTLLVIYYGSKAGFEFRNRHVLSFDNRTIGSLIADLNQDEWLDIAFVASGHDRLHILWGSKQGFKLEHSREIKVPFPISLEAADFNEDGFLDLVVGSYMDRISHDHDMGLLILWGSSNGFHSWNAQWLPGFTPVGMAVADFDSDGYLDIFSPHYLSELTRESIASYLYWGADNGFSTRNRTILITDSAHDAMAADFNKDGQLDLAVSSHTRDGNHHTASKVFYNDGNRFRDPKVVALPTVGTHWMWIQDVGHIYHRQWQQTYQSSIFNWDELASEGFLRFQAALPQGTHLNFEIRSSASQNELVNQAWRPIRERKFEVKPKDRHLQYRATLGSSNGDLYPVLDRVEIQLKLVN